MSSGFRGRHSFLCSFSAGVSMLSMIQVRFIIHSQGPSGTWIDAASPENGLF